MLELEWNSSLLKSLPFFRLSYISFSFIFNLLNSEFFQVLGVCKWCIDDRIVIDLHVSIFSQYTKELFILSDWESYVNNVSQVTL
jgi:hypothetical protein